MALPFIAGLAVGGLAVYAFNNKKEIKKTLCDSVSKTKEMAKDVKKFTEDKFEKISSKKPEVKTEKTSTPKKRAPRKSSLTKEAKS